MKSIRIPLVLLSALAAAASCVSGAPPRFSQGEAWTFPLVGPLEGGLLLTPVTIDGKGPYLFAIDPDAVTSAVDDRVADDLELFVKLGPRLLDESDTTRPTRVIDVTNMRVGTLTISLTRVMVHPAGTFAVDGRDVHGVLGRDLIADSVVFGFDRDAGMAYLATHDAFEPPAAAARVPFVQVKPATRVADQGILPRRVANVAINGVATRLHLDLGAATSQLHPAKWKRAKLVPVPFKAMTMDELGTTRAVDKAGIANRVEAGAASAMGLVMIPYADKRWEPGDLDGTLGLNFFAPYRVWADWHGKAFYLTARDGESDQVANRIARWDADVLVACKAPACATARLESIAPDAPGGPAAGDAAPAPSPNAAMPAEPAPAPPGVSTDPGSPANTPAAPMLIVERSADAADLGYELLLEAVGADGRSLGLPRLAATFPPGKREVRERLAPIFAGARFRVLDVSPFMRACPGGRDGCVFELVPPR